MYMYTGLEDLSWVFRNEHGPVDVRHCLAILTGLILEKISMEVIVEPFYAWNQPGDVSSFKMMLPLL